MRSDEGPDGFLYKKDRCRDRLNSVTPKEGPLDRGYEDIILQCLPPDYDRICQTHFEREDCNLEDIRRMTSKIYADNLARSHSDSSRGIAGRGVAMQATGRDLRKINCYYCNKFDHYKNDCADFKAAHHHQNRRRRQRHHKQRGGHQPDQPKPGGQQQQRGGGGANMVLTSQDHHPQRRRLTRHAGKRAQRQRPLRPSPSSERFWDLQFVGPPCAR